MDLSDKQIGMKNKILGTQGRRAVSMDNVAEAFHKEFGLLDAKENRYNQDGWNTREFVDILNLKCNRMK